MTPASPDFPSPLLILLLPLLYVHLPFPLVGASKSIFLGAVAASANARAFADG